MLMKVLFIISGDVWAGAEVQTFSLINAFAHEEKMKMHVITFNEGVLSEKLREENVSVTVLDEKNNSIMALCVGCLSEMRKFRPDIVHMNGFKENILGGIAGRLIGVPALIRTHHGKAMIRVAPRYDFIERINGRFFADYIIAVSHDLKKYLVDFGLPSAKITVIHNGVKLPHPVDEDRLDVLRKDFGIKKSEKVIGTVGRLVKIKDQKTFLKAAKQIVISEPCTKFVVVGDGPLKSDLERQAREIGIDSKVIFTGFRRNVSEILNLFDVFALTSIHEGVPMALLEAMALGKPVVATRVGGVSEVIVDQICGLFVDPENPHSFSQACLRILRDSNLKTNISEQSVSMVKSKFTLDHTAMVTKDLYRTALKQ